MAIRRPLDAFLVLDLGQIYNGPYCGLTLGFMGARVLKIEHRIYPGRNLPIPDWHFISAFAAWLVVVILSAIFMREIVVHVEADMIAAWREPADNIVPLRIGIVAPERLATGGCQVGTNQNTRQRMPLPICQAASNPPTGPKTGIDIRRELAGQPLLDVPP